MNPIFAAAEAGDIKLLNEILNSGIDVNCTDAHGETPLFHALSGYTLSGINFEAVELLIMRGAKVNIFDGVYSTPLSYAISGDCDSQDPSLVKLLLRQRADINGKVKNDRSLTTPISDAVDVRNPNIIKILLDYNPDLSVPSTETLIHKARAFLNVYTTETHKIVPIIKMLEEKKAQIQSPKP